MSCGWCGSTCVSTGSPFPAQWSQKVDLCLLLVATAQYHLPLCDGLEPVCCSVDEKSGAIMSIFAHIKTCPSWKNNYESIPLLVKYNTTLKAI